MGRREGKVEDHAISVVAERKGYTRKVVYQGRKGSADRWCFFAHGRLLMLELKSAGKALEELQLIELKLMRSLGFWVAKADTREQVDAILHSFFTDTLRCFNEKFPLA